MWDTSWEALHQGEVALQAAFDKFRNVKRLVYYKSRRDYDTPQEYAASLLLIASHSGICNDYFVNISRVIYRDCYIDEILSIGEIHNIAALFARSLASYRWVSWAAAQSDETRTNVIENLDKHLFYLEFSPASIKAMYSYRMLLQNVMNNKIFMKLSKAEISKRDCYAAIRKYLIRCLVNELQSDIDLLQKEGGLLEFFLQRGWKHDPSYESVLLNFKETLSPLWSQKYPFTVEKVNESQEGNESDEYERDRKLIEKLLMPIEKRDIDKENTIVKPFMGSTFCLVYKLRAYSYCGVIRRDVKKTIKELKLLQRDLKDSQSLENGSAIFKEDCKRFVSFECAKKCALYPVSSMSDELVRNAVMEVQRDCKKIVIENIMYCRDLVKSKANEEAFLKM